MIAALKITHATDDDKTTTANVYARPRWKKLIDDIVQHPEDEELRLAAAKIERRNGAPERAEFIELQNLTAKTDPMVWADKRRFDQMRAAGTPISDVEREEAERRKEQFERDEDRVEELFRLHARRWFPELTVVLPHVVPKARVFGILRKGFLDEMVARTADEWYAIGPRLVLLHPITKVTIQFGLDGKRLGHHLTKERREKKQQEVSEVALKKAKEMAGKK